MIPSKIVRFLEEQGNMGFGGVRDGHLRPSGCRVSAWRVGADGRTVTALVPMPASFRERFLGALLDNRQFAMTIEEHPTHETYQFKGRYLRHRDANAADHPLVQQRRDRLIRAFRAELPPGLDVSVMARIMHPDPTYAIEFEVREIFLQTPGPRAGAQVYPAPEA